MNKNNVKLKSILKYIISFSIVISLAYTQCDEVSGTYNQETGWCFNQSTFQAFYMFQEIQIDGMPIEPGQGTWLGPGDVVGAFKDGVCLGWVYADVLEGGYSGNGFTTLPIMGNDGTYFGLSNGDFPDEILIYDYSNGTTLELDISETLDLYGNAISNFPGWTNNEFFTFMGTANAENAAGCTDETACNYDETVNIDDGTCWFAGCGCTCDDGEGALIDQCIYYNQSTFQSFYMYENIEIDNEPAEPGLDADTGPGDYLIAYKNDNVVGATYALEAYTTLPLMGNDGSPATSGYISNGQTPDSVVIVDMTYCSFLDIDISNTTWINGDDSGSGEYPGWRNNEIFILNGTAEAANISGCTDQLACNYNSSATFDDGSCEDPLENFDCDGNCIAEVDCDGECGGSAEFDECGICNGNGIADGECDCDGNVLDCNDECGGSAAIDECGVCDGFNMSCTGCTDPSSDNYNEGCEFECIVNSGCEYSEEVETTVDDEGNVTVDEETTISSGDDAETNIEIQINADTSISCDGEGCPIEGENLEITVSEFEENPDNPVNDIPEDFSQSSEIVAFEPFGLTFDDPITVSISYEQGSRNEYMILFLAEPDADWGVIAEDAVSCSDGTCSFSTSSFGLFTVSEIVSDQPLVFGCTDVELCGYNQDADYDNGSCFLPDCYGDCSGDAYIDGCGDCVGGNTGETECPLDCNQDPGGSAIWDECGICSGGNSGNIPNNSMTCTGGCTNDGLPYIPNINDSNEEFTCTAGVLLDIADTGMFIDQPGTPVPVYLFNPNGITVLDISFLANFTNPPTFISVDFTDTVCAENGSFCDIETPFEAGELAARIDFRGLGGFDSVTDIKYEYTQEQCENYDSLNPLPPLYMWDTDDEFCFRDYTLNNQYDEPTALFNITGAYSSPSVGDITDIAIAQGSLEINGFPLENDGHVDNGSLTILQSDFDIRSTVTYYANETEILYGTELTLSGTNYNDEAYLETKTLQNESTVIFTNVARGSYSLKASRAVDEYDKSSITSFDAAMIAQHLVWGGTFDNESNKLINPNQLIAADASNNGIISSVDATKVARFSIDAENYLNNDSIFWSFYSDGGLNSIEVSLIDGLYNEGTLEKFNGILLGDVSGDWTSDPGNSSRQSSEPIIFHASDNHVSMPVYIAQESDMLGIDFSFTYDNTIMNLSDISIENSILPQEDYSILFNDDNGIVKVAIYATGVPVVSSGIVLDLSFNIASEDITDSYTDIVISLLQLNELAIDAGFGYDSSSTKFSNTARVWIDDLATPEAFHLYQNYPNPFNPATNISWYQPDDSPVSLSIYDISGALVETIQIQDAILGANNYMWDGSDASSGIYMYIISHGGNSYHNKMVLIK